MSSVFDPGKKDRQRASQLGQQGIIRGGSGVGAGGLQAGFSFKDGNASLNTGLGDFQGIFDQMLGQAGGFFGASQEGLPQGFQDLASATQQRLGNIDVNRIQNQEDFSRLGELFNSRADFAQRDVFDVGSEISGRLRALSERRDSRNVNKMFDRLKRTGNLTSSAGIQRSGEMEANLMEQGLRQDLAGLNFGQQELGRAFQEALGASGMREQIGARQFGEEFALENLGGQRALQQFGVGQGMFENLLRSQFQNQQLGMQGLQGAMGLSQLPLGLLQALQGVGGQASNSLFAAAGIEQNNASMAKSPFLEAINAAGGFMSGMGGLGDFMTAVKPD